MNILKGIGFGVPKGMKALVYALEAEEAATTTATSQSYTFLPK